MRAAATRCATRGCRTRQIAAGPQRSRNRETPFPLPWRRVQRRVSARLSSVQSAGSQYDRNDINDKSRLGRSAGPNPGWPTPSHPNASLKLRIEALELLVDRQDYIRARWLAKGDRGWEETARLLGAMTGLMREPPRAPAPEEHVHYSAHGRGTRPSTPRPWSGQPNTIGTRIRWPDEEIGRNSVTPWTTPSVNAWSGVMPATGAGSAWRPRNRSRGRWHPLAS